jgi:hypothetical protein
MLSSHRLRLWTFALCAVAGLLAGSGAALGEPVARINSSVTEGTAPLTVMFDALDCEGEIAGYTWDLGDEGPTSRRTEHGWLAAHRYEEPGRYTVTLTVRDESGQTAETSVVITVREWEGKTFYFSETDGDDTRPPAQAQNPSTPWQSLNKLREHLGRAEAGTQLLLKRGDVFETGFGRIRRLGGATPENPVIIGAYGEGPPPTVGTQGTGMVLSQCSGMVIQDIRTCIR